MAEDKMPFLSHLEELRRRLIASLIAIGVGFSVSFYHSERIMGFLKRILTTTFAFQKTYPYVAVLSKPPPELIFVAPAEAFWAHIKIGFLSGILLAIPFILYELWRFVAPGMVARERRYALPFVVLGTVFFFFGLAFCYFVVLPFAMNFLLTYKTEHLKAMLSIGLFIDFTVKFLLAFGLIFQLPLLMSLAAQLGLVTSKFLTRNRKYAILLSFVIAAILTPTPDIFNQTLMAGPLCLLYEVGIWAVRVIEKTRRSATREEAPEGA
ncbi:MAG: twin-arginine translocase subunit TatC [Candidatus Methylomirabilales bacterium]|nr:twin-arginine translocase subunit TatC [candidate division NC10 bacterium]MCZ6550827.1 twin-arginine translocase subunit TatC [candidate division NC10 bacterium]